MSRLVLCIIGGIHELITVVKKFCVDHWRAVLAIIASNAMSTIWKLNEKRKKITNYMSCINCDINGTLKSFL